MTYDEYLRTPEWRRTRADALIRAGNCCSLDVAHKGNLDVHHNNYERRGCELPTDLGVLCRACHERHHTPTVEVRDVPAAAVAPVPLDALPALEVERKPSLLRRLLSG